MDISNQSLLNTADYREVISSIAHCMIGTEKPNDIMREILLKFNISMPADIIIKFTKDISRTPHSTRSPESVRELFVHSKEKLHTFKYIHKFKQEDIEKILEIYDPCIKGFINFYEAVNGFECTVYQVLCDLGISPVITTDTFHTLVCSIKYKGTRKFIRFMEFNGRITTDSFIIKKDLEKEFKRVFRESYGNKYDDVLRCLQKIPDYNPFNYEFMNRGKN